ncbi:MAG: hypothetical protein DYG98_13390 [Haliscomenobacteraceae bacterium CHB4]|nr:hypothetical protein [Haliscomenobacteraceae bacterium CHB4]
MDGGRWTVDGGRWTVDGGRWTVDGGRWTVDGGRWTVIPPTTVGSVQKFVFIHYVFFKLLKINTLI